MIGSSDYPGFADSGAGEQVETTPRKEDVWKCVFDGTKCARVECLRGPFCVKYDANPLFENQDEAVARYERDTGFPLQDEDK